MDKAADTRDLETLAAHAHPLKSSAANFGATALSRLAADIENAVRVGDEIKARAFARKPNSVAVETSRQLFKARNLPDKMV